MGKPRTREKLLRSKNSRTQHSTKLFQNREIIFVELPSGDVLFRTQSPIVFCTLNVCSSDANHHKRTLLVQGHQGEKVHLFLESRSDPRIVFPPDSRSVFLPLNKFDSQVSLVVQGDLIIALTLDSSQLDVSIGSEGFHRVPDAARLDVTFDSKNI